MKETGCLATVSSSVCIFSFIPVVAGRSEKFMDAWFVFLIVTLVNLFVESRSCCSNVVGMQNAGHGS